MAITTFRPNSFEQFSLWKHEGKPLQLSCLECGFLFSRANVSTPAGWRETQISGWCEECFDEVFEEEEEEEE